MAHPMRMIAPERPARDESAKAPNGAALLLSVPDAAKLLSVSATICWGLVKTGELPSVKLGPKMRRVAMRDLEELVDRLRAEAARERDYWPK